MGIASRNKGKRGEREVARLLSDLLGVDARRLVRQHAGDSDVVGVDGWVIEVKRCERATPADISRWWDQAVAQAQADNGLPALFYRQNRRDWRVVWPLSVTIGAKYQWQEYSYAVESSPAAWAAVVTFIKS